MTSSASRAARRTKATGVKRAVGDVHLQLPFFFLIEPLTGANVSTQYSANIGYRSLLAEQDETIRIEISLREPLLTPVQAGLARTLLLDPVSSEPLIKEVGINCISWIEAFAEKFRAALTRREAAVRDFFDIDYAVRRLGLHTTAPDLIGMVQKKLAVPGNEPVDVSDDRLSSLRREVETRLKPVLRSPDFAEFDIERAFETVRGMAEKISQTR